MTDNHSNESFRLMDLPREVRNEIYKAVVRSVTIGSSKDPRFPEFDGLMLDIYPTKKTKHWSADYPELPSDLDHTSRDYKYDISTSCSASIKDLNTLRNLSNINSIIRKELAEVTWARSAIHFDNMSILAFEIFLMDRPAIWPGIKKLHLDLSFFKFPNDDSEFPIPNRFVEICELASNLLQLESLDMEITIQEDDVVAFFETDEKPGWVEGVRKLPVKSQFNLLLYTVPNEYEDNGMKQHLELQKKYQQRLKEEICPDSLRPKVKPFDEMTEVERYMANRL